MLSKCIRVCTLYSLVSIIMQECLINRLAGASLSLVKHCSVVQSIDEVYRVPRNYWRAQLDMPPTKTHDHMAPMQITHAKREYFKEVRVGFDLSTCKFGYYDIASTVKLPLISYHVGYLLYWIVITGEWWLVIVLLHDIKGRITTNQ